MIQYLKSKYETLLFQAIDFVTICLKYVQYLSYLSTVAQYVKSFTSYTSLLDHPFKIYRDEQSELYYARVRLVYVSFVTSHQMRFLETQGWFWSSDSGGLHILKILP